MCTQERQRGGVMTAEGGRRGAGGFPLWSLWLIWPAIWLAKGVGAAAAPLLAALMTPLALSVSPLPLLLIGVGVALLLLDRARGRG
ncbi:hypothetical protein K2Z83_01650 [Oscillochloris sp. ZM17-4]|uniref:hypothetical protein n=1 Tax=Oscillochloris sp. ZM17-4 TaxID=2866714 RepID=UPI001C72A1E2|nr:hypothetical protein [Oscillochloris sp. ZM17-4]MBX0326397.1 hypothetical protein [Oscillochloris sp. ZM17-4]